MDDLISRQAAIYNLANIAKNCAKSDKQKALMGRCIYMIENMPSVQPEQKTGRWKYMEDCESWFCSNCKDMFILLEGTPKDNNYNFCPNCEAKMEVKYRTESEDKV